MIYVINRYSLVTSFANSDAIHLLISDQSETDLTLFRLNLRVLQQTVVGKLQPFVIFHTRCIMYFCFNFSLPHLKLPMNTTIIFKIVVNNQA